MFVKFLVGVCLSCAVFTSPAQAGRLPGPAGPPAVEIRAAFPGESIRPGTRTVLEPGGIVEVRWSGLPDTAAEVELLLSLDEGRTYSVRLTDDLDPKGGSFLWKVPGLETDRARLAIRMGSDGREVIAATTSLFEISPDPSAAPVRLLWRSGEIWTTSEEGRGTAADRDPGQGLASASESVTALPESADAIDSRERGFRRPERPHSSFSEFLPVDPRSDRSPEPFRSSPGAIPQRI